MEKIKRAKGISIVLSVIMVFQLIMPVNFAYGYTGEGEQNIEGYGGYSGTTSGSAIQAKGAGLQKGLGNIFTFDYLKLGGVDIEDGKVIEIDENTIVNLGFTWDTKDLNARAGDTASIQLSEVFKKVSILDQPIYVSGTYVGDYSISDGVLTFVFNDGIETSDVQNGLVDLGLEFNLAKFKQNIKQEIPFNDSSNTQITVISEPTLSHSGITKEGHPNVTENAKKITWEIDVINTSEDPIAGATVTDTLPAGLGVARDFVIYELNIGIDGSISKGAEAAPATSASFPISLGNMAPYSGYRIVFETDIDYNTATAVNGNYSFINNAAFEYGEISLPATATVSGLTRSNPIDKDGWVLTNAVEDTIRWRIDVNKNGMDIDEAIVKDTLQNGLYIVPDSVRVIRITQSGNSWNEGSAHSNPVIDTSAGLSVGLGALTSSDAYRIEFDTTVDWSLVGEAPNIGEYLKNNGFTNNAALFDGGVELNHDDATVDFVREPILKKVGVSNVDYTNKTITWTVTVNEAKHPLGDVVVTDILPAGLTLTASDISISGDEGNSFSGVTPNIDITNGGLDDGKTKLTINLEDVGTETITIEYTTTIIDFNINSFLNKVGMSGDGVGEGGSGRDAEIKPAANTYKKDYVTINYNTKEISWKIAVNPQREAIDSLKIEDSFPNRGMILLPDTIVVKMSNKAEPLVLNTDYTLVPRTENGVAGYQKGFVINVPVTGSAITLNNAQLTIEYKTSYDPQKIVEGNVLESHTGATGQDRKYINSAEFTGKTVNGNNIDITDTAETTVGTASWNSGKKEGRPISVNSVGAIVNNNGWSSGAERKIAWQLYLNYQKQNLGTGVSVTDTLAYAGSIDADSIKVSVYNVATGGGTTITSTVLDPANYSVATTGGAFTLAFAEGFVVNERYVIEFTTSVPDRSAATYTNNAIVTTGSGSYPYSGTANYNKHNSFLEKGADGVVDNKVYTGDEVNWTVKVNESLSIIHNAVITDTISAGHAYKAGSLEIFKLQDSVNALEEGKDYTPAESTTGDGETVLTITLSEALKDTLVLKYTTVVTTTNGKIDNKVSLMGNTVEIATKESSELSARLFSSVSGEWAHNRGALRVIKVDAEEVGSEGENIVINNNEATFELWYDFNGERVEYTQENPFTTHNGVLEIGNLPLRTYYLVEKEAPTGYVLSSEEIMINVVKAYGTEKFVTNGGNFENTKIKIDVTGTKVWQNGPKPAIQLQLFRGVAGQNPVSVGAPVTLNGTESTPWQHIWTNLDKTDMDGNEYTYTVDEVDVPTGYTKSVSDDGLEITNTYVVPSTQIKAEKVWEDGSEERPTVWFKLYRKVGNGEPQPVAGAEIKKLYGITEVTWTELEETDINGNKYIYSVKEVDSEGEEFTPENYVKTENGLKVTNSYISPTDAYAKAIKVWVNGSIDRPTVWFKLFRQTGDGEVQPVPDAELKELSNNITEVVWTGLTKTDNRGNEYTFSVQEVNADGEDFVPENYEKSISEDGFTITNTYVIPKDTVTATKVWDGGSSPRPTVWFELYRQIEGGEREKVNVELKDLSDGTTEVTWDDLEVTDIDGNVYIYSVKEVDAAGNDFVPSEYTKTENGLTVTNTRKPTGGGGGTTPVYGKVTVKKVDEDKKVLSGAEFTLYDSKGKVVGKAVTGSDGTVSFEELEQGEYVLKETKAPEGYVLDEKETDVTISANKTSSYTITNRKEEPKKPGSIEIIKTDEEGKLLSDAWFSLIDEKGSTLQNAGTVNGRVAFEDVPVGRYTVKEVQAPEGYELSGKAVTVTVESNKTVELSFVNKKSGTPVVPANGRITINKVDENSNALAGAEFTLYDENNRIVETAVTDKDGKVVFESLKDGRYFVKETKAPEGYVLVNEAKIVDIAGGQTYSYKFKNVPESVLIEDSDVPMGWETIDEPDVPKGVGTLPNTGYILNTWMLAALGLLLIAEGLFLRKRRKVTN